MSTSTNGTNGADWTPSRAGRPWVAVDCGLLRNPKVATLGARAFFLYIAGLCHCADELTDGHIAPRALPRLAAEAQLERPRRAVTQLVREGLWHPADDGGWDVNDYLDWNPSRAWFARRRERERERKAEYRARARAPETEIGSRYVGDKATYLPAISELTRTVTQSYPDPNPEEHKARPSLSPGDTPRDDHWVSHPLTVRNVLRTKSKPVATEQTRDSGSALSNLGSDLRQELERLAGDDDGLPV